MGTVESLEPEPAPPPMERAPAKRWPGEGGGRGRAPTRSRAPGYSRELERAQAAAYSRAHNLLLRSPAEELTTGDETERLHYGIMVDEHHRCKNVAEAAAAAKNQTYWRDGQASRVSRNEGFLPVSHQPRMRAIMMNAPAEDVIRYRHFTRLTTANAEAMITLEENLQQCKRDEMKYLSDLDEVAKTLMEQAKSGGQGANEAIESTVHQRILKQKVSSLIANINACRSNADRLTEGISRIELLAANMTMKKTDTTIANSIIPLLKLTGDANNEGVFNDTSQVSRHVDRINTALHDSKVQSVSIPTRETVLQQQDVLDFLNKNQKYRGLAALMPRGKPAVSEDQCYDDDAEEEDEYAEGCEEEEEEEEEGHAERAAERAPAARGAVRPSRAREAALSS